MSTVAPPRPPITLLDTYRFFVPLMLMAELMMISHAVVVAFLARMPDPQPTLAAYSVAFYLHAVMGSPIWALQIIVLSFIRDRASVHRLALFGCLMMGVVTAGQLLVGLTPLGDWVFRDVFNTSAAVAAQAKLCMVVSVLSFPTAIARSLCYGLMMLNRKTVYVTAGTVIRMLALAGILWFLASRYQGAVVGVVALTGCIMVESLYALAVGSRFYRVLQARIQAPPPLGQLWRFSWPVILMQAAENGVAFTVNFFLGRLPRPELAIAAFGVLDSLVKVLLSPLRNLVQTTQSLVQTRADARVVLIFAAHMALIFGALLLALSIPSLRALVLSRLMGLGPELVQYVTPGLALGVALALTMASTGVLRGMLIANHRTGIMAVSSALRIAAVAVVGGVSLMLGVSNGATLGIVALIAAFGAESVLLALRLKRLDRDPPRLFEAPLR